MNQSPVFQILVQAYTDYQPIRMRTVNAPSDPRSNGTQQLYFAQQWGANSIFFNLDDRSYRDIGPKQADGTTDDTGPRADNAGRTMLGETQSAWIQQQLVDAQAAGITWKFVAVSSLIDQIGPIGGSLTLTNGPNNGPGTYSTVEFYSPDTFNYATLEIGTCPTLAVTVKGTNSYAVNSFPQPNTSNPLRQILRFEIDADSQPPLIKSVVATPSVLWPPNHKMVPVTVKVAASDNCVIVSNKIVSVTSNAPQDGPPDWQITGDLTLLLRAERNGSGGGRTYTLTAEVTDSSGTASRQTVDVAVPHSMGG